MNIRTERLLLRPVEPGDADFLVGLWTDPVLMEHLGGPRDPEKLRAAIEQDDPHAWVVVERVTGEPVGDCFLLDKEIEGRAEREIIWVVAQKHWGRGFATEAARAVMQREPGLCALIHPENAASIRVAEKAGMRHEKDVDRPGNRRMRLYRA